MRKILVIQTASIGDVILATALLEKLTQAFPEAQIDFLVKKGMEPLFEKHPFIHQLLVWDKSKKSSSFFRLLGTIRQSRYNLVINLQRFTLTGLLTAFSGGEVTIGFDKNPLSRFFSKRVPHEIGPGIHEIHRNQKLIEWLTDRIPAKPRLYAPQISDIGFWILKKENIQNLTSNIQYPISNIYYTISPASLWFTKQFPADRWVELIREIPEEATVFLLGSKADHPLCEEIMSRGNQGRGTKDEGRRTMGEKREAKSEPERSGARRSEASQKRKAKSEIVNLAGQLTLLESAALMRGARMNFTNDSAPMHLASAVNAPVTAIYCSTTPAFGFGPLSDDSVVVEVTEPLSCRPCGLHGRNRCPEGHFNCAYQIGMNLLTSRL